MSKISHRTVRGRQHHMVPVEKMVQESISFIREYEPAEGYFVGFSGGKDSIVTLELARMSGVKHEAYYCCTGIDPPEVVKFIKEYYSMVKWLYPKYSFWRGIRKEKMPPLRTARWCCDVLKKDPSASIPLRNRLLGLRREESLQRRQRPIIDYVHSRKQTIYKPIFHWKEWHIWDFIDDHHIPYPSLYDEGFHRIGCVVCPFLSWKIQMQHKQRWPKMYEIFEGCVRKWYESRGFVNKPMEKRKDIKTVDDYLLFWYGHSDFKQPKCTCPMNECAGVGK